MKPSSLKGKGKRNLWQVNKFQVLIISIQLKRLVLMEMGRKLSIFRTVKIN